MELARGGLAMAVHQYSVNVEVTQLSRAIVNYVLPVHTYDIRSVVRYSLLVTE